MYFIYLGKYIYVSYLKIILCSIDWAVFSFFTLYFVSVVTFVYFGADILGVNILFLVYSLSQEEYGRSEVMQGTMWGDTASKYVPSYQVCLQKLHRRSPSVCWASSDNMLVD